jgi:putative molybdopterin biosynthesis protein
MGALIASGHSEVNVVRRPIVGIIPTGTELVEPEKVRDRPPAAPEIIDYNSVMLAALAAECGASPIKYPIIRDDLELIKQAILDAAGRCDLVIINAGSGRGSEDYTAATIADTGDLIFNSVSIRPGKPVMAGIVNNRPVLGIPGYPVSAFLTFRLFAAPLIARLLGVSVKKDEIIRAVMSRQLASPVGIDEFVRVNVGLVGNKYIATPAGRGAGMLMSVVRADGMIKIPACSEGIAPDTELDVEIFREKDELRNSVVCIGSHDNALDILANFIKKRNAGFALSSSHVGSMGGIMALNRGEAHMAGIHLLDSDTGEYNVPFIKRHLAGKRIVLINFAYRVQGLLVRKGNPKKIGGLADLARKDVAFINRQAGSGTRLLLDKCLADLGICEKDINGYGRDEYTHMAVASSVLTGLADTGLAVYSAAKALDLDFIAVAEERYDLAVPRDYIDSDKVSILIDTVRNDREFRECVNALGGYDMKDTGNILYES